MRTRVAPLGQFALSKRELEEVFSRLRTKGDWHRAGQRITEFNKLAKPAGVRLSVRSQRGEVIVTYESAQGVQELIQALTAKRGHLQGAFANLLNRHAGDLLAHHTVPARLVRAQAELLSGVLSRDLGVFSGLALEDVWVDVAAPRGRRPIYDELGALLPAGLVLTGDGGSGKTAVLQRLLARWGTGSPRLRGRAPVYIAARHLRFDWSGFELPWSTLPGVQPGDAERLRSAFEAGRLLLLIDGVNDNPTLTDFAHPAVQSFWAAAAKNICVLTTLPAHYEAQLKSSPIAGFFRPGLTRLEMPAWGEGDYGRLFSALSRAAAARNDSVRPLGRYLNNLSAEAWHKGSELLRRTPLSGLACANFVATHEGRKLPRNEYELMEHMLAYHLRHEYGKASSPLFLDTVKGFLTKLAWQAYVDCLAGQWYVVSFDTATRVLRENYPLLDASRQTEVLSAVVQLPYLERDNGSLCFNPHFTDFLVAREILQTMIAGDFQRLRQVLSIPWAYANMSRTLFQGIRCLDSQERKRYLKTCETLFQMIWQEYLRDRSFRQEVAMAYVLQPLGFLDLPEVRDTIRRIYATAGEESEFVAMSCGVCFGWHGDHEGLRQYVERLKTSRKAAKFNLQFYLFYRRTDRLRLDLENFTPELIRDWGPTCDWLLYAALRQDPDFRPLRLLYAFTLCNFLRSMGPGPFMAQNGASAKAIERRARLAEVLDTWAGAPDLRRDTAMQTQVKDLRRLAGKNCLIGGKQNGSKRTSSKPLLAASR